jgi:hypothetical protein
MSIESSQPNSHEANIPDPDTQRVLGHDAVAFWDEVDAQIAKEKAEAQNLAGAGDAFARDDEAFLKALQDDSFGMEKNPAWMATAARDVDPFYGHPYVVDPSMDIWAEYEPTAEDIARRRHTEADELSDGPF